MQSTGMAQRLLKAQTHTPSKPKGMVQEGCTDSLAEFPSLDQSCMNPGCWVKVALGSLGRDRYFLWP